MWARLALYFIIMLTSHNSLTDYEVQIIEAHRKLVNVFPVGDPRREIVAAMHAQNCGLLTLNIKASMQLMRLNAQHPLPPLALTDKEE